MNYFRIHIGIRIYWFLDRFGRQWNDFKDFIGHPSDPKWLRWIVDKTIYPHEFFDKLNKEMGYKS